MKDEPRSILVVDDDADIRETLQIILEMDGYNVGTAADGAEALTWLRSAIERGARPSLILLDLMMPGMNGIQFREAQRLERSLADIPAVVVTGAGASLQAQARSISDGVLIKPVQLADLNAVVRRFCGSS